MTKLPPTRRRKLLNLTGALLGWVYAFLPLALVLFFWHRSKAHSDFGAVFTPSGNIQGVASHQGNLVVVLSSLNFGRERGLTLLGDEVDPTDFTEVYDLVYASAPATHEKHRFGYAASKRGDSVGDAAHVAVQSPMWAVALLCLVPPLVRTRNTYRRWRRHKEGFCQNCGYDLRASTGRCPECGTAIPSVVDVATAEGA